MELDSNHLRLTLPQLRELALLDDDYEDGDRLVEAVREKQNARLIQAREAFREALLPYGDIEAEEQEEVWLLVRRLLDTWREVHTEVGMIAGARMTVRLLGLTDLPLPPSPSGDPGPCPGGD